MNRIGLFLDGTNRAQKLMSFIRLCWNSDEVFLGTPFVAFTSNIFTLLTIVIILSVLAVYKGKGDGAQWWLVFDAVRGITPIIIRTHYITELSILKDLAEEYRRYILCFCNVVGALWCSVVWLGYIQNVPLAFANASLVICIIHGLSTTPSYKIAKALIRDQDQNENSGYYERLTQSEESEVVQLPDTHVDDQAYAQKLQDEYLRVDQDKAYDELLVEKAKEQSLQVVLSEGKNDAKSTIVPALSPLKPEATEGRVVKVRVRNLHGSFKTRNFQPNSQLSDVYKWLIKTEDDLPEFQLVTAYPRAVFKSDETTLKKTGIIKNPNAEFDLSQTFAMEEKTEVEKKVGDEVENVNREEA